MYHTYNPYSYSFADHVNARLWETPRVEDRSGSSEIGNRAETNISATFKIIFMESKTTGKSGSNQSEERLDITCQSH